MRDCEKRLVGFVFPQDLLCRLIFKQLSVCFTIAKIYQETLQWFQQEILSCRIITVKSEKITYFLFSGVLHLLKLVRHLTKDHCFPNNLIKHCFASSYSSYSHNRPDHIVNIKKVPVLLTREIRSSSSFFYYRGTLFSMHSSCCNQPELGLLN